MIVCKVLLETEFEDEKEKAYIIVDNEESNPYSEPAKISKESSLAKKIINSIYENETSFILYDQKYKIIDYEWNDEYKDPDHMRKVDFSDPNNPVRVLVYKSRAICATCQRRGRSQNIESVTGFFITMNKRKIDNINLQYCINCDEYFIDSRSLSQYDKKFGRLYCIRDFSLEKDIDYSDFAPDSVLSRTGYTADGSMGSEERHKCIAFVIMNKIWNKAQVASHLNGLIDLNGDRCYKARPLWEEDLKFTNEFELHKQRYIGKIILIDEKAKNAFRFPYMFTN